MAYKCHQSKAHLCNKHAVESASSNAKPVRWKDYLCREEVFTNTDFNKLKEKYIFSVQLKYFNSICEKCNLLSVCRTKKSKKSLHVRKSFFYYYYFVYLLLSINWLMISALHLIWYTHPDVITDDGRKLTFFNLKMPR